MPYGTPVLLIAWRRPETTRRVIEAIRPFAPAQLFVACDGPRTGNASEAQLVLAVRRVIEEEIDWPCALQRRFTPSNQGCKIGVSSAIQWFFEHVEEGVILEDDCLPSPDFLPFCESLLDRYRTDSRIWCISGNNFQEGQWRADGSYYFSRYMHCWGWASWRRCWAAYDRDLTLWPSLKDSELMDTIFDDPQERAYWSSTWDRLKNESEPDTWDYQWMFTVFANGGLVAIPNVNLVSNIGFGPDATHTQEEFISTKADQRLGPLVHPSWTLRDSEADRATYKRIWGRWNPEPSSTPLKPPQHHHWRKALRARLLIIPKMLKDAGKSIVLRGQRRSGAD